MTEPNIQQPADQTLDIDPRDDDSAGIERVDGRTREARAAKAQQQGGDVQAAAPPARAATRRNVRQAQTREPARSVSRGAAVVQGRDGEMLSRKRTQTGDIFHIPPELIEPGWEMQWCAVTVTGNSEILMDQNLMMRENGWRPVPASRYPGRFMPEGHEGSIIRGGQLLMERPKQLCDDARAEDIRNAKQLMSDRNDALKLSGVKKQMGPGFEMGQRYRGTGGDVRMNIDPALDIPAPSHTLAEPGE